jgi:hypothetical protein
MTNTLAYYNAELITFVKFYSGGPRTKCHIPFLFVDDDEAKFDTGTPF